MYKLIYIIHVYFMQRMYIYISIYIIFPIYKKFICTLYINNYNLSMYKESIYFYMFFIYKFISLYFTYTFYIVLYFLYIIFII